MVGKSRRMLSSLVCIGLCAALHSPSRADDAECLKDLNCIWEAQMIDIQVECRMTIEGLAKWDFEWTDGVFEPAFQMAGWADKEAGSIMIVGDKLKLQNGYGAWKHVAYLCAYDPKTKKATGARVIAK